MTAMRWTAGRLGCTTRAQVIEPFQPHGVTCVLILAESHITVSTWPEYQLAHIDVFTCRADSSPSRAIQPLLDLLAGQITHAQNVPRTPPGSFLPPQCTASELVGSMTAVNRNDLPQQTTALTTDGVAGVGLS
jgi:S-adenosylmethionine decarboxylase proenzyme